MSSVKNTRFGKIQLSKDGFIYALIIGLMIGMVWLASGMQAIPYNFREMFSGGNNLLISIGFVFLLLVAFGVPVLLAIHLMKSDPRYIIKYPVYMVFHAIIIFAWVRLLLPLESIHDVVGVPVLAWNAELERAARFVALFSSITLIVSGAAAAVYALVCSPFPVVFFRWMLVASIMLCLGYWIVVSKAATDNLVELLAFDANVLAAMSLAAWLFFLGFSASVLSARIVGLVKSNTAAFIVVMVLLFVCYGLMSIGLNPAVEKYGARFSAMQFLLSPDRDSYLPYKELLFRYVVFHFVLVFIFLFAQYYAWDKPVKIVNERMFSDNNKKSFLTPVIKEQEKSKQSIEVGPYRIMLWTAVAYLIFVIYGSLVPLNFNYMPISEAVAIFLQIPFLDLGIGSRADWVANLLLFIPLSFLWMSWFSRQYIKCSKAVGFFILSSAVLLCVLIEFAQMFFPPRTVSQNDLLAESLGAFVGIILWCWRGRYLVDRMQMWREQRGEENTYGYLLWLYLAAYALYSLMPLDLTISPVELFHKWDEGKFVFIPFSFPDKDVSELIYGFITDVGVWIPVVVFWVLSGRASPSQAWIYAVIAATILEFFQIFVYSRITDITDIFTAMLGAAIGVLVIIKRQGDTNVVKSSALDFSLLWVLLWVGAVLFVFWYPFDFYTERSFLRERFEFVDGVLFRNYYFGSEYRAITSLLHQVLMYAPIGILSAHSLTRKPKNGVRLLLKPLFIIGICVIPLIVEVGQVALPSKVPDLTDALLGMLAGFGGYYGYFAIRARMKKIES